MFRLTSVSEIVESLDRSNLFIIVDVNTLAYHRLDIFTGADDHCTTKSTLNKDTNILSYSVPTI